MTKLFNLQFSNSQLMIYLLKYHFVYKILQLYNHFVRRQVRGIKLIFSVRTADARIYSV